MIPKVVKYIIKLTLATNIILTSIIPNMNNVDYYLKRNIFQIFSQSRYGTIPYSS